jgi:8-oxo-dGTP pyrophosphatase MutT (NUDIX family)
MAALLDNPTTRQPDKRMVPEVATRRYSSAGGVVVHEDNVLVLDRPDRDEVRLPKGHIEDGESPDAAALRETAEEAGYDDLEIIVGLGDQVVEFDYKGHHYVRNEHYFLMHLRSDRQCERGPKDAAQFRVRWVPIASVLEELTFPAEQDAVRRALV